MKPNHSLPRSEKENERLNREFGQRAFDLGFRWAVCLATWAAACLCAVEVFGNTPPVISNIADQSISKNSTTGPLVFQVTDAESDAAAALYSNVSSSAGKSYFGGNGIEFGDQIFLAGSERVITDFLFETFLSSNASGDEKGELFIRANDGANGVPGTVLYRSGVFNLEKGFNSVFVQDAFVTVAHTFTWSVLMTGIDAGEQAGLVLYSAPTLGTSFDDFWQNDPGGWTAYIIDNGATPANFGAHAATASGLTVTASSSNTSLVPVSAISMSGQGSHRTVTVTPTAETLGTAQITLMVSDGTSTASEVFTVTVTTPKNHAPSFTKGPDQNVLEDAVAQKVPNWATAISTGDEAGQVLTFQVTTDNSSLFSVAPSISSSGELAYTLAPNTSGSATVTVILNDDGGVENSGSDTSAPQTFVITVSPKNDSPTFNIGTEDGVLVNSGARTVAGWATSMSPGGGSDEASQVLTFQVSNNNASLFAVQPAISPAGALTYTPATDATGTATVTVTLKDDGGTANGGSDVSSAKTFVIRVTPFNTAPSFVMGPNITVLEDSGMQTVVDWASQISPGSGNESGQQLTFIVSAQDQTFFSTLPAISSAGVLTFRPAPNVNGTALVAVRLRDDGGAIGGGVDSTDTREFSIVVTAVNDPPTFSVPSSHTVLEDAGAQSVSNFAISISRGALNELAQEVAFEVVSNDNPALFSALPALSPLGVLTYTPAANANGVATVTVRLKDNGLTANGGNDTSATQTFVITVSAVNEAPSFTKGADQSVAQDSPAQTVAGWATNLNRGGGADESSQTLSFQVSNNNTTLFSVQPAIASDGTLTYTPASGANGVATVTVTLKDSGGTLNGGVDTSAAQTFTITLTSPNVLPTITQIPNQTLNEDQVSPAIAFTISDTETPVNSLELSATSSNAALVPVSGIVFSTTGADRTMTITPAANASGTTTITVSVKDSANGVRSTSFVLTVNAVNDLPVFTKGADQIVAEDSGFQNVSNWATGISVGPANESTQTPIFQVSHNNPALFATAPAVSASGALTYTPAAHANGVATVTVTLTDSDGASSSPQTFTIQITAKNDPPIFTKGADQTVLENSSAQTVIGWATGLNRGGGSDEAGQVLTFQVGVDNPSLFSVAPAISSSGTLTYTPAANARGSATVTVTLKDDGGVANGGVDTSAPQTFVINITGINRAPGFANIGNQTVLEDSGAQTVLNWAGNISPGPADEANQTVEFQVTNNNPLLFMHPPRVSATGTLTYTTAPDANGSATVTVILKDNGGVVGGGIDASAPQTFILTVSPVNDPPSFGIGLTHTISEDGGAQTVENWAFLVSSGPNESGQLVSFEIVSNDNGSLFSVQPLLAPNGTLTYTPAANANGVATVTVRLKDDGGIANGGNDTSATQTFVISVLAVNEAPVFTKGPNQSVPQDSSVQTVSGWASNISRGGGADEATQTLTFQISNSNANLFTVPPAISPSGTLTYTPAAGANGVATLTVTLKDNGGIANGGVDTSAPQTFTITLVSPNVLPTISQISPQTINEDQASAGILLTVGDTETPVDSLQLSASSSNPGLVPASGFAFSPTGANRTMTITPAANQSGTATITVTVTDGDNGVNSTSFALTVNSANDAPSFTKGADQIVLEDSGAQTVPNWATAMSAGPSNESGQTLTFQLSHDNPALFSVAPAISAAGMLSYTPSPDANGTATVTVTLKDNGGVLNGGNDTSAAQTFKIEVTPKNDPPSFVKGPDQGVLENSGARSINGWATALNRGGGLDEFNQTLTFLVSTDNPSLFATQPAITSTGTLSYTPATNARGSATVSVILRDGGGTTNGGSDTSGVQTFVIDVTGVNRAPTFTKGPDITVLEDAGLQTVVNWARDMSAGPADESGQSVSFLVSNNNSALFSSQPSIAANGTLTFAALGEANGSATVTVLLRDNGGTVGGGSDTSAPQTFIITVEPVNDEPKFVLGLGQGVGEDSGPRTISNWVSFIPGGRDESGQAVTFSVSNNNTSLFSAQPAIGPTGTLTYTPAPNASGSARVTVVARDDGGTANGGRDTSVTQEFTIDVQPVNDPPSFTKGPDQTLPQNAPAQRVPGWATNLRPGGGPDESVQFLTFRVTVNNSALFSVQPTIDSNGTLTYTPAPGANGVATVTVTLQDSGGTTLGGIDTSPPQSFTITATSANRLPTISPIAAQSTLEDQPTGGIVVTIGDSETPVNDLKLSFASTNPGLASAADIVFSPSGANRTLIVTPRANESGSATVTVTVTDGNNGVASAQFELTVTPVNDAPSFRKGPDQVVLEDSGSQLIPWATDLSPGPANEGNQTLAFQLSNNNPSIFSAGPSISSGGILSYTPAANASGTATVTVALKDNGGTLNGGRDNSATQTFTIQVTPKNDPPSFAKGPDQSVLENSGAQTVNGWATLISRGGGIDESTQGLTFQVSTTNPALFAVAPAISSTGTLTYTPAPNARGSATISVALRDNGGTANGGNDTSAAQTFVINVTGLNRAPLFTKGADQSVLEDGGAQTVPNWATGISAGPPDESGQSLAFQATNNNPVLFAIQPAVAPNGTLTYTPATNATGSATISVTLKDNGGVVSGGVDTSAAQTFTIIVTPVNDAPGFKKGADVAVAEDSGPQTIPNWASLIVPGPANESSQALAFQVSNNNPSLFAVAPAVSADGTLTFTTAPNINGVATVSVVLKDDGGTAAGGVDTSAAESFVITVREVNQRPVIPVIGDQNAVEGIPFSLRIVATDPDEPVNRLAFRLGAGAPEGALIDPASGLFTWTPGESHGPGTNRVTVLVTDDGLPPLEASRSFMVVVGEANVAPVFNASAPQAVEELKTLNVTVTATDADLPANRLSYRLGPGAPAGMILEAATGRLTWTPSETQAPSTNEVTVIATDDGVPAMNASHRLTIIASEANQAPTLAVIPTVQVTEGSRVTFTAVASDPDLPANNLTFSLGGDAPSAASIDPVTGVFNWETTELNGPSTNRVTVRVTDDSTPPLRAIQTVTIVVSEINSPPVLAAISDQVGNIQSPLTLKLSAVDTDFPANKLTFRLDPGAPVGAAVDPASGLFSWTPSTAQGGTTNRITVRVSDDSAAPLSDTKAFTVIVRATINLPPVLTPISNQSTPENTPTAPILVTLTDPDTPVANYVLSASSSNPTLVPLSNIEITTSGPNRTVRIVPAPNRVGVATITLLAAEPSGGRTSTTFEVAVTPVAPVITRQPVDVTVLAGGQASFDVRLTGTQPMAFQWSLNGTPIPGGTNSILFLANASEEQAGAYSVEVSNAAGRTLSQAAQLTVDIPLRITRQPISQTILAGGNVTFVATANGRGRLSYQWQLNGVAIPNANEPSLVLVNVEPILAGDYTVVVSNGTASVTSEVATLLVNRAVGIVQQPQSVAAVAGKDVSFSVEAAGTPPLAYQWLFNGLNLEGKTEPVLTLPAVAAEQAGEYSVLISNVGGAVSSAKAILTVAVGPQITRQPVEQKVIAGAPVTFNVTASGSEPISYQWQRNGVPISQATGAALQLAAATAAEAGEYTVVVSNSAGSASSQAALLAVVAPVVITQQPQGLTLVAGQPATFSVVATGTAPLQYQWRLNGVELPGATGATLSIANVQTANAGNYDVLVSNEAGTTSSAPAPLIVNVPVNIIAQPVSQAVTNGASVVFSVSAVGTAPLTYQWQFNGAPIANQTGSTLVLNSVTPQASGAYAVVVRNPAGSVTSQNALLSVLIPPTIQTQPAAQNVPLGANVSFTVTATGDTPLNYQWQLNGINIPNANQATLSLANVQAADAGSYTVVVENPGGTVTSASATLTLILPPISLGSTPEAAPPIELSEGTFDGGFNEAFGNGPARRAAPPRQAEEKWFSWKAPSTGIVTFKTAGSTFDTEMAVYTGPRDNLVLVVRDDDGGGFFSSEARFNAVQGTVYHINIKGFGGATGRIVVSFKLSAGEQRLPVIVRAPEGQTVAAGSDVTFSVQAEGTALNYQWFANGAAIANQTQPTLLIRNVREQDALRYSVLVSSGPAASGLSIETFPVLLQIGPPDTVSVDKFRSAPRLGDGVQLAGLNLQPGKNAGGSVARGYSGAQVFNTFGATKELGEPNHASEIGGASQWFTYQAPDDGVVRVSTDGSDFDTVCAVYSGSGTDFASLKLEGFDNNSGPDARTSLLTVNVRSNVVYFVAVDGVKGASGKVKLSYDFGAVPSIAQQPSVQTVLPGSNVTLAVQVTNRLSRVTTAVPPVTYQWIRDGVRLIGETTNALRLVNVQVAQQGDYAVIVSNFAGALTSSIVRLSVVAPVSFSVVPRAVGAKVGERVVFRSLANGTPEITYQWRRNGVDLAGETRPDLQIESVQEANAGVYTVIAQNAAGPAESPGAALAVSQAPVITVQPANAVLAQGQNGSLTVQATGTAPLSYQWRKNGIDLLNQTSATLTLNAVTPADAGEYKVVVSNEAGSVVSAAAVVSVRVPLTLTGVPRPQAVTAGSSAVFSVVAAGSGPFNYQWRRNGQALATPNSATLALSNVQVADAGEYSVLVISGSDSIVSPPAALEVSDAPVITVQPLTQSVFAGTNVLFAVTATGAGPLRYQWAFDGAPLAGQTNAVLALSNVRVVDTGAYSVTVSNAAGSVISSLALLTVVEMMSDLQISNGVFQFRLTVPAGRQAVIEATDNLVDWTNITPSPIGSGTVSVRDDGSISAPVRFYRVVLQ